MLETLKTLQKLKVDCLYKRSTHFNASSRLAKEANIFRILLIIGTIFASFSSIMNVGVWDKLTIDGTWCQILVNILGALGGFLILYSTTFSDYKTKVETANKHLSIGDALNLTFKKIRNAEAEFRDGLINNDKLVDLLDDLTKEYIENCKSAPKTKKQDYLLVKQDFEKGYLAEYTEEELGI